MRTKKSRTRYLSVRVLMLVAVIGVFVGLAPRPAGAHTGDQSYLYLNVGEGLTVEVHMPFVDLEEHLGLDFGDSDESILTEIEENADLIARYAQEHTSFGTDQGEWQLINPEVSQFREGGYVAVNFGTAGVPEQVPNVFDVSFDPFFAENPERDALFIVANDVSRGIIGNEEESFVRFTPDNAAQEIDLGDASNWKNFTASVELGLDHIRTGPDHILFIAVLILPSVLVFRNRESYPATSFFTSLKRIVKIVSMFTVAHSITFTIAGLGIIEIDDFTAVEAVIAISITAAAIHNLKPIWFEKEWMIAFGFGLFHGLGFASLVSNLEVSRTTQLLSLLGRNVGIEIGQVIVVLVTFPALFLLRRTRFYKPFMYAASVGLIIISLAWFGERVFDTNDWASLYTEEALLLPRAWLLLAIFTAICAFAYWFENNNDRLLPPAPGEGDISIDLTDPDPDPEPELVGSG